MWVGKGGKVRGLIEDILNLRRLEDTVTYHCEKRRTKTQLHLSDRDRYNFGNILIAYSFRRGEYEVLFRFERFPACVSNVTSSA